MADISRAPFLRHLRGASTVYIRHVRRGRVAHEGVGLAFWFRPLTAVLSEVPVDDRELPLMFHVRTRDFQDLAVTASVTFRVTDPALATTRVDFSIDPNTGAWRAAPLEQLANLMTESAQQHVLDLIASLPLDEALGTGLTPVRERVAAGLREDTRLAETGLTVLGARVVAMRPEPEVEKALRTPTRELIQQAADKATYERRALAVERERAISENELQNQIALARQEEQLVAQRGANARRKSEEAAAADAIDTQARASRERLMAEAQADARRAIGAAEAAAEAARLDAYRDLSEATLLGLAMKELAGNLPQIGNLTLTPDLLAPVLAKLGGTQ